MLCNSHILAVNVTGRFHTKTRIRFILVITYKKYGFFDRIYLDKLAQF